MKAAPTFVAIDLGAESGRVVLGTLRDGKISLDEVNRCPNRSAQLPDGLHWDICRLLRGGLAGLELAAKEHEVRSVAVDSWGVDYGLLDEQGRLLGLPYHYRDHRTDAVPDRVFVAMEEERAYETTGIRQLPFNTVYQLLAEEDSAALRGAHRIALIPDLLAYWLSGQLANERTDASTTGLLDARTGDWAMDLIDSLGLPGRIFGELVEPGTVLGSLLPAHTDALGINQEVKVVATAGHDTAAAFAGTPLRNRSTAVLSSGTWSLLGLELDEPVLSQAAQHAGLSNERGVFGTTRLLNNVMGLWLLQQCRERWTENGSAPEYGELTRLATASTEDPVLFDPDDLTLLPPGDMPARIEALIARGGQSVPSDRGGIVKSIFVSLACKYRMVIEELERVASRTIDAIHVVGGGSRNELLSQLTADITGREVLAGPSEASALGNVLMQAYALGHLSALDELREVSRDSFPPAHYHPTPNRRAEEAIYGRFLSMVGPHREDANARRDEGGTR